ncbi:MAG: iron-containing alcohol dehydrogenase [Candidatus Abyssobacteria bacterium SURF_17]|uniref:Iron-containing alcohol dehydrogenase n=1 Tax=Candidatus Abyssobacteria bacterium SURF_17 TaxID=2093361 RepID=A0A419F6U8_9BACT|nr:MAG: iron-containing alcohol dehydrogenase [Candidatus Abyssubacteria bacterium SURF_17]
MTEVVRFSFPTFICYGPGAVKQLPLCLEEAKIRKLLLVTDNELTRTEAFKTIESVLKKSKVPYVVFSDVHPNPATDDVEMALRVYQANDCNGVVGLGGGSALDAAKVIPVRVVNDGPLTRYNVETGGNATIRVPLPPMIAIPTTAGTGSEVGRCSVLTDPQAKKKFLVCHQEMMPRRAILDPLLTVGLPAHLTAATGMDAFTHNLEALTVDAFHPMCDAIALKGMEYVAQYLERAVKNPTDIEARGYMMLAAMMGAVAFQKDLGAAHSMAHPLSTLSGVHHGLANAICLVPVMKFNRDRSAAKYARIAQCFGIDVNGLSELEAADKAIEAVADLNRRIGIPRSLAHVGVTEEQLSVLARSAVADTCHRTNPRPCSEKDFLMLFQQAFEQT